MAYFTTRVELHHAATSKEYDELHEAMKEKGFSRTIKKADNDSVYHLPTAEYTRSCELTKNQVLEDAKQAASKVVNKFSVLVTQSSGSRVWFGLSEVKSKTPA